MRDMVNNKQMVALGALTLAGTTPNASAWVDVRGFDACTLAILNGTITDAGTADGFTATMQHSDTTADADAVDCTAAEAVSVATIAQTDDAADDIIGGAVGYTGNKRYVRLNFVGTTGTDAVVNPIAILNKPHRAPTTFAGTSVAAT